MKKWIYLLLLLAAFQFNLVVEGATTNVVNLKCEYRENPIGIGEQKPMLIWQIESAEKGWMQSAYEIKVASSESGKPLVNNEYFGPIKTENGKTIVDIGSGSYSFTINQQ